MGLSNQDVYGNLMIISSCSKFGQISATNTCAGMKHCQPVFSAQAFIPVRRTIVLGHKIRGVTTLFAAMNGAGRCKSIKLESPGAPSPSVDKQVSTTSPKLLSSPRLMLRAPSSFYSTKGITLLSSPAKVEELSAGRNSEVLSTLLLLWAT